MSTAAFARRIWIIHEAGLAVGLVTKGASTSIKLALSQAWDRRTLKPSLRSDEPVPAGILKVIVVRSPWERVRSCWADKVATPAKFRPALRRMGCKPGMAFDGFVKRVCRTADDDLDKHLTPQHYLVQSPRWDAPDLVLRVETLVEDWAGLRRRIPGLPELPRLNASRSPKPHWTSRTVDMIGERYHGDAELLGYGPP